METLSSLRAFRNVVDRGGFTRAADFLQISPGSASKLVAQLEQQLGTRLLHRSTRKMSLTEAGRIYHAYCVRVLDELDAAEQAVQMLTTAPRGLLRISVPTSFGILRLSRLLPEFLTTHSEIRLDVVLNDRIVDLHEEGFDLALRITSNLPDSSLVAKPICELPRVLVASPDYLERAGHPGRPADLAKHNCLLYSLSATPGEWSFGTGKRATVVSVRGNYHSNNSVMFREALLSGVGIAQTPRFMVEDLLESGALVACLQSLAPSPHRLSAMLPEQRAVSPKVRAFVDFLSVHLSTTPVRA